MHAEVRHAHVVGIRVDERNLYINALGLIDGPALNGKQGIDFFLEFPRHEEIILLLDALRKAI
jgi:hypothetical protein